MDYIKKYEESSSLRSIRSLNCSNDFVTVGFVCIIDRFINRRPFFFWVWLFLSSALRFRAKREFSASLFFCSYNSAFRRRSISRWAGFSNRCCLHSKISSANQRPRWKHYFENFPELLGLCLHPIVPLPLLDPSIEFQLKNKIRKTKFENWPNRKCFFLDSKILTDYDVN